MLKLIKNDMKMLVEAVARKEGSLVKRFSMADFIMLFLERTILCDEEITVHAKSLNLINE